MLSFTGAWLQEKARGQATFLHRSAGLSGVLLGSAVARFAFTALAVCLLGWVSPGGYAVPLGWCWDLWLSVSARFSFSSAAGFLQVVSNPENVLASGVPLTCGHELHICESVDKTRRASGGLFLSVSQVLDL